MTSPEQGLREMWKNLPRFFVMCPLKKELTRRNR